MQPDRPPPTGWERAPDPGPPPPDLRPQRGTEPTAVLSLVLGALSLPLLCVCGWLSPVFGVAAIVLGAVAMRTDRERGPSPGSRGVAIAGIVCGALGTVVFGAFLLFGAGAMLLPLLVGAGSR